MVRGRSRHSTPASRSQPPAAPVPQTAVFHLTHASLLLRVSSSRPGLHKLIQSPPSNELCPSQVSRTPPGASVFCKKTQDVGNSRPDWGIFHGIPFFKCSCSWYYALMNWSCSSLWINFWKLLCALESRSINAMRTKKGTWVDAIERSDGFISSLPSWFSLDGLPTPLIGQINSVKIFPLFRKIILSESFQLFPYLFRLFKGSYGLNISLIRGS